MARLMSGRRWFLLVVLLQACSGGGSPDAGGGGANNPDAGGGGGGDGGPDAGPATLNLISRSWSQGANSESYQCREIQATSDLLLTAFEPALPPGQFRMWLLASDGPTNATSGDFACTFNVLSLPGNRLIYAAGIGTDDLQFPSGVGVRIKTGQYVTLVLHIVNVLPSPLSGTSGVTVVTATQVANEADMIFAGTMNIDIPPGGSGSASGGCTVAANWNVFALLPMANKYGVHHKLALVHSASTALHDASYDFNHQLFDVKNATVVTGDQLQVTCDYFNSSQATVHAGPNANDEVCLTGLYRYPAPAVPEGPFACVSF